MSMLTGNTNGGVALYAKDRRLVPIYQDIQKQRDRISERHSATQYPGGYTSSFWPGGRGLLGDLGVDFGVASAVYGRPIARLAWGCASRVGFVGVSFDQYGTPLAGVTCSLFRTSTKEWIMDFTSASDGTFLLQSWYSPDQHFIVFYKAGSPDVFGTTRQTLVGA
jgi:hypothetical protein